MRDFRVADTNMLVSKKPGGPNAKPDRANAKPGEPNASLLPNASRWNIGHIRSPCVGARISHVDFMLSVSV